MFARVEALAIRSFITDKIKSITTFDYQRAWNKLQADLYKKQAHYLEDFKAILADPKKINQALKTRNATSSSKLNRSDKYSINYFEEICVLDLSGDNTVNTEDDRVSGFMKDVFNEFKSEDSKEFTEFTKAKSSAVDDQDPRRVAIILEAVCFQLEQGYYFDNAKLIAKINDASAKANRESGVNSDPVFSPARKQQLIKDKYPELRALAERALLTQRLKSASTSTDDQRQSLQLKLLQKDVEIAALKVTNNIKKTKTTNPYGFFANKNYTSQQKILAELQGAGDVAKMGDIADKYKHLPYIACSPTMGPLLRSISHQAKQLKTKTNMAQKRG